MGRPRLLRPVGCIGVLGRCLLWRRKTTPRVRGAPPLKRPRFSKAREPERRRAHHGTVKLRRPPSTAMSEHGHGRAGAHINQRSTACAGSHVP